MKYFDQILSACCHRVQVISENVALSLFQLQLPVNSPKMFVACLELFHYHYFLLLDILFKYNIGEALKFATRLNSVDC